MRYMFDDIYSSRLTIIIPPPADTVARPFSESENPVVIQLQDKQSSSLQATSTAPIHYRIVN